MRYFFVNLAVHLIVTVVFAVLTCIFAGRNKRKKTKHVITYFFPILFALIAIIDIALYTAPRLMDINSMINSNYFYTTGDYYYMNPLHNTLSKGDVVRVEHTPYSLFTVEITKNPVNALGENSEIPKETV